MNIENLKNMPTVGQPVEKQIGKLGTAIKAAAAAVSTFGDSEEALLDAHGVVKKASLNQHIKDKNDLFEQIFSASVNSFDKLFENRKNAFDAAVADAESNNREGIDSLSEALARLNAVDDLLETSLVNFLTNEQASFDAVVSLYGELSAIDDAIALI